MCDGVTQGEPGMELSLLSREVIAMSTAVALSHNMFDAALMLGICDKIVPGLMMGALRYGHLPMIFVPGGPMPSGISNKQKADVRQRYAEGKASREELLESEMKSYHSPGTCTFYGTANTNQLLMEVMGLHLPGASFVNPYTPLRDALTREAAHQVTRLTKANGNFTPIGEIVDENPWSTPSSLSTPPAARPTTPCICRPSPWPRASSSPGRTWPTSRKWCRPCPTSTRTVKLISTTSRRRAACRS